MTKETTGDREDDCGGASTGVQGSAGSWGHDTPRLLWDIPLVTLCTGGMSHHSPKATMGHLIIASNGKCIHEGKCEADVCSSLYNQL